jgi:hypothetical protein
MLAIAGCLVAITFVLLIALLKTRVRRAEFARLQRDVEEMSEHVKEAAGGRAIALSQGKQSFKERWRRTINNPVVSKHCVGRPATPSRSEINVDA